MFHKFKSSLKKIDIFGQQISLSFRQEDLYKTSLGGFISLCILGTILSFFYSNIIGFFAMTSVSSNTQIYFEDDPSLLTLTPNDFMFAIQIDQTNFSSNPYYNFTVEQRHYQRLQNGTINKLPTIYIDLVPCTFEHFSPIFQKYGINFQSQFDQYALQGFLCPNISRVNNTVWLIGGNIASADYYFMRMMVTTCVNNSDTNLSWKPVCQPTEAIKSYLKSRGLFRAQIYTVNYLVNPDEPQDYIQPYLAVDQYYSFIPDSMLVQSDIFFRSKKVITDRGILMYEDKSTEFINFREHMDNKDQITINQNSPNIYAYFFFNRSPYSFTITRNFLRLDELLSYLGGFAQFMLVVLGVFVLLYNKYHLLVSMANDIYQFKKEDIQYSIKVDNSEINQSSNQILQKKKTSNLDQMGESRTIKAFKWKSKVDQSDELYDKVSKPNSTKKLKNIQLRSKNFEYFEQFKQFVSEKLRIGLGFRVVMSLIFPVEGLMTDECLLIKKALDQITKELDLSFILQKLQEISKLKQVLFNDEQITLFNFSQKPMISLIKENNRRSLQTQISKDQDQQEKDIKERFQILVQSYSKINSPTEEQMTEEQIRFNLRLIVLLGSQLCKILDKELGDGIDESYEPNPEADEDP